ncbi:sensor histidine kinase [Flexithrix dorotheae]|uniref:sensor histidine kinase n=1 Tax=Flexithrix dorotheae TaxID=70993 RepID=UPI000376247F|nr:HAMP domain-containing sensor histidine kinase [Flexithrix dorotheae]
MRHNEESILSNNQSRYIFKDIREKANKITSYTLTGYFLFGILISPVYDTWIIGIGVGSLCLLAYFSTLKLLPESNLNQYVASASYAIFMAQFIYQMHGMFEMHFWAFIGSTLLIIYQNWKLQLPLSLIVAIHHGLFAYLQFSGVDEIYFTQLQYMDLQTFLIHIFLATFIFLVCGYWSYDLSNKTLEMGHKNIKIKAQRDEITQKSERLSQVNEEINTINQNLEEIVAHRTTELMLAKEELNLFLYRTSHDLKGPLARIEGLLQLAKLDENEQEKSYLPMFDEVVWDMSKTLEKLLAISTIHNYPSSEQSIGITRLIAYLKNEFKDHSGSISYQYPEEFIFISKPVLLKLILKAIVENALIFQYQKPEVVVSFEVKNNKVLIVKIADNGIGIEEKEIPNIFEMFYKGAIQSKGNGLGLFIVKQAIKPLNGEVTVKSEVGKGTTFTLTIPVQGEKNKAKLPQPVQFID